MIDSFALALVLVAEPQAPPTRSAVTVDATGGSAYGQLAAASGGDFSGVLWVSGHLDGGRSGVYLSRSDGRGVDWADPIRLDGDPTGSVARIAGDALQVAGNGVYALWSDGRNAIPGNSVMESDLWLAVSTDGGATWGPERRLDPGLHKPFSVMESTFAVDSLGTADPADDHLLVAALLATAGGSELRFLASRDGGRHWEPPRPMAAGAADVRMSVDGPRVHLLWSEHHGFDHQWLYQRSEDGGRHWLPQPVPITQRSPEVLTGAGAVAAEGPVVAVAWTEHGATGLGPVLRVRVSGDGGRHFGVPTLVGNYPAGRAAVRSPTLLVDRGTTVAAWSDNRAALDQDFFQAFAAASRDLGHTWFESPLSPGEGREVQFARGGPERSQLVAVWTTSLFQGHVEASISRDGGLHWSPGFRVNDRPDHVLLARVAWNARYDNAVVAWLGVNSIQRIRSMAGGFRPQWVHPEGFLTPGGIGWFSIGGFPRRDEGLPFGVLISAGTGHWGPAHGFRDTGLLHDPLLEGSYRLLQQGALNGTVLPGGIGTTPPLTIPPALARGKPLFCAAVAWGSAGRPGALTDVVEFALN